MKRMNVREFRAKISELTDEPIEVTRYSTTVGFWVPQGMTTMPKRPPKIGITPTKLPLSKTVKAPVAMAPRKIKPGPYLDATLTDEAVESFIKRIKAFNEEFGKVGK